MSTELAAVIMTVRNELALEAQCFIISSPPGRHNCNRDKMCLAPGHVSGRGRTMH